MKVIKSIRLETFYTGTLGDTLNVWVARDTWGIVQYDATLGGVVRRCTNHGYDVKEALEKAVA